MSLKTIATKSSTASSRLYLSLVIHVKSLHKMAFGASRLRSTSLSVIFVNPSFCKMCDVLSHKKQDAHYWRCKSLQNQPESALWWCNSHMREWLQPSGVHMTDSVDVVFVVVECYRRLTDIYHDWKLSRTVLKPRKSRADGPISSCLVSIDAPVRGRDYTTNFDSCS